MGRAGGMSTCCTVRLKEIRGDSEERVPRARDWRPGTDDREGDDRVDLEKRTPRDAEEVVKVPT